MVVVGIVVLVVVAMGEWWGDFSRTEKLLPLIRDLYELHNLRKTAVTSNLTTAITTVIVLWRWHRIATLSMCMNIGCIVM